MLVPLRSVRQWESPFLPWRRACAPSPRSSLHAIPARAELGSHLSQGCRSRPMSKIKSEIEEAMPLYDTDQSGQLEFTEFVNMICVHPCFRLTLSKEEKERLLQLAQLLEVKMAQRPGHPVYLAKQESLSEEQKAAAVEDRVRAKAAAAEKFEDNIDIKASQTGVGNST